MYKIIRDLNHNTFFLKVDEVIQSNTVTSPLKFFLYKITRDLNRNTFFLKVDVVTIKHCYYSLEIFMYKLSEISTTFFLKVDKVTIKYCCYSLEIFSVQNGLSSKRQYILPQGGCGDTIKHCYYSLKISLYKIIRDLNHKTFFLKVDEVTQSNTVTSPLKFFLYKIARELNHNTFFLKVDEVTQTNTVTPPRNFPVQIDERSPPQYILLQGWCGEQSNTVTAPLKFSFTKWSEISTNIQSSSRSMWWHIQILSLLPWNFPVQNDQRSQPQYNLLQVWYGNIIKYCYYSLEMFLYKILEISSYKIT